MQSLAKSPIKQLHALQKNNMPGSLGEPLHESPCFACFKMCISLWRGQNAIDSELRPAKPQTELVLGAAPQFLGLRGLLRKKTCTCSKKGFKKSPFCPNFAPIFPGYSSYLFSSILFCLLPLCLCRVAAPVLLQHLCLRTGTVRKVQLNNQRI